MKVCDLSVEQYLGVTQAWGTGVWILTTLIIAGAVFLWKRWKARQPAELATAIPPYEGPRCLVCGSPCSRDLYELTSRTLYVRGDWEELARARDQV